ncbi:MAG: HEAT repeat domain-containing protein [Candidatus Caldarchaeum sp.]|nr:HEAT repeat domain-containing protein [Candidatus Caldarchaeum sp.]MDW7978596.1 HEAT repeat domain-containing protein [Candidatus Caldarchaeum sp.]MDW8359841.1 HEAT repeat domain-containing protein [Candidatus Caldarchaeum sp.]
MKIPEERIRLFFEMEDRYMKRDAEYFRGLLKHSDFTVRARATCILAELGGKESIKDLADVLLNDENPIVRHEASYSLGQLGFREAIPFLVESIKKDPHPIVRHESAIALGVIGREDCVDDLVKALEDPAPEVVDSAVIALSNIEFCRRLFKMERETTEFARKTGG